MGERAIHWGGGVEYTRGSRWYSCGAGYPACISGQRARDIRDRGDQTWDPLDVTCKRCIQRLVWAGKLRHEPPTQGEP